jgi:serine/threonine-protein kinase
MEQESGDPLRRRNSTGAARSLHDAQVSPDLQGRRIMAAPHSIDRQTFLRHLRQSGLVEPACLSQLAARFAGASSGRTVARTLVEEGVLTRFQAERLLAGRTAGFFLGQYRILDQLGRGGMGRVYKAQHLAMQRTVALKVLAPDLVATERAVKLFRHELQAVGQLVHPNIVTAYDANEVNGRYFLVLEHVDGPNLDQLVRRQGPLSVGLACDYVRQVASGLQCAYARGMLHRDIKPANILVQRVGPGGDESPGLVKISDFGLARLGNHPGLNVPGLTSGTIATRDNTVMGTPDYLSPEQARDLHRTDIRSDLYSLGCTFYFLLTGQVPFPGGTAMDKLIRHASERPAPIEGVRPDVPPAVLAIVDRLLAKSPDDRFQTPAELVEALQPYAVTGPTPWAPPAPPGPFTDALATPTASLADETSGAGQALDSSDADLDQFGPGPLGGIARPGAPALNHLKLAVLSGIVIVTGLLLLCASLALLFR